jgi:hypothetical protein
MYSGRLLHDSSIRKRSVDTELHLQRIVTVQSCCYMEFVESRLDFMPCHYF